MEPITRIYNTKDVDMILSIDTIIDSAIANKVFLQTKRSTWADPYFQNIKKKINEIIQKHLGVDNAKTLRQATDIVKSIQANALLELAEIKVQIEQDFKATPDKKEEILNQLGFTTYFSNASASKDQEALINLLYQYKANLTTELKNEIVLKGTAAAALNNVVQYADNLKNADVTQEGTKGTKKEITEEAIQAFNEIYGTVSSIAIIAAKFYKGDTTKKDLFSFNQVSKALNNPGPKKPKIV
jgi:septum formation topological specificity factor MinE